MNGHYTTLGVSKGYVRGKRGFVIILLYYYTILTGKENIEFAHAVEVHAGNTNHQNISDKLHLVTHTRQVSMKN